MDLQEILNKIHETKLSHGFKTWVPTLEKEVALTGLTNGHQQTFVQNLLSSPYVNSPFIISFSKSIGDCWQDEIPFDPSKLSILDKSYIMVSLWANSYNNEKTQEVRKHKFETVTHPDNKVISVNNYKIVINYPSILKEAQYAKYTKKWTEDNLKAENPESITILRSLFYLLEPLIYIQSLSIDEMELDLNGMSVDDQIKIGESIPLDVLQEVNKLVDNEFKPFLDKTKTVSIQGTETVLKLNNSDFIITNQPP